MKDLTYGFSENMSDYLSQEDEDWPDWWPAIVRAHKGTRRIHKNHLM